MRVECVFIQLLSLVLSARGNFEITDEDYRLLPPIYHMDPYNACRQEQKMYCRVELRVHPIQSDKNISKVWKLIEATKRSPKYYNHDELNWAICLHYELDGTDHLDLLRRISQRCSKKYESLGIKIQAIGVDCNNYDDSFKTSTSFDALLIIPGCYLLIVILATYYDVKKPDGINKYLVIFSVTNSLKEIKRTNKKFSSQNLKCIQGFRFYTTLLILFLHIFLSFSFVHVKNTEYIEDIYLNPLKNTIITWSVFLVQTYFLISAWLLSYHAFQVMDTRQKYEPVKFVLLTFLNRYFRLVPPVFFTLLLGGTTLFYGMFTGPIKHLAADREYLNIKMYGWRVLLFVNNFYNPDACFVVTWYLSTDIQLYLLSLIILVGVWKYRSNTHLILGFCTCAAIFIAMVYSFVYNLNFVYRMGPEQNKYHKYLSQEFFDVYASTLTNMATYMIGLVFGYIYYTTEKSGIGKNKLVAAAWWIIFIGSPSIAIILSCHEFDKITNTILSGIIRPLYVLGMGVGILGMSHQLGGIAKRICEWKPVIILGNFTYSTYISHFIVIFYRMIVLSQPAEVSNWVLIFAFIKDTSISFTVGYLIHLIVEVPMMQLQALLVPKMNRLTKVEVNNKNK